MAKYEIDKERLKRLESDDLTFPEFKREALNLIETLCGIIIEQGAKIQESRQPPLQVVA